jgi:aspartyl protease family protein
MVVLTNRDARKLGFDLEKLAYTQRTETANGVGMGAPVMLREIRIGPIVVNGVRAMVNQAPMSNSLLGISFLERLSGYSVEDGTLTLRQ